MWTPISLKELEDKILNTESQLTSELSVFWNLIKIIPEKWKEDNYGDEGGGFWAVAIFGHRVIWYNDIEEGFNISTYNIYGKIGEYNCNQDSFAECITMYYNSIRSGKPILERGQAEHL